mmetsp:Transcript_94901/g.306348  ORF Transcript_94901/g.306348 Transcript_94901/m.306348 type:complete len:276 (+) Transcript_94901:527-1354(+)
MPMNSSKSMTSSPDTSYSPRKFSMALSPCTCRIFVLVLPVRILSSSFFVTVPLPSWSKILKASQTTSSLMILFLSMAAAMNSVYSMVSLPSVPTSSIFRSPGTGTPAFSNALRSSPTVMWPLPSRSRDSKICRRCCVSSSVARQARAVMAAFCSMLRPWKWFIDCTTSIMMFSSGRTAFNCNQGCSRASMTSHRTSAFFLRSSASRVLASLEIFFQALSLKLTGSRRICCSSASFVFARKGYWPERMMYMTTPALQASHFWSYCTGAVTSSGATL